jgi:hypothetical protein
VVFSAPSGALRRAGAAAGEQEADAIRDACAMDHTTGVLLFRCPPTHRLEARGVPRAPRRALASFGQRIAGRASGTADAFLPTQSP